MSEPIVCTQDRLRELIQEEIRAGLDQFVQQLSVVAFEAELQENRSYHSVESLSTLLKVDKRTLRRWELEGLMPKGLRIGGVVRWPASKIHEWIDGLSEPDDTTVGRGVASPVRARLRIAVEPERRSTDE